ncbi:MAG: hypothetical protein IK066_09080 [Kiritimatiellae bacterium]|nr:hypothetical protein [Kiritimatiellia bacterium]
MKRMMALAAAAVLAAGVAAAADGASGGTESPAVQEDVVLLVAPARYNVMQVAFDVARRYSTVLVSYQGADPDPKLHVWNGYDWLALPMEDYRSGAFLQAWPGRAVLLGGDDLLPGSLKSAGAWCREVKQLDDLETVGLVNGIGTYLPFTPADWRWFAGRYNLSLVDERKTGGAPAKEESWYDKSGSVEDPKPGFFKYFTRTRTSPRGKGKDQAPEVIQPVEVLPGETVTETH